MPVKVAIRDLELFDTCARQWAFQKSGHERQSVRPYGYLRHSQALHGAIRTLLVSGMDPVNAFQEKWEKYLDDESVLFRDKESWQTLNDIGIVLMEHFQERIGKELDGMEWIGGENRLKVKGFDMAEGIEWELVGNPDVFGNVVKSGDPIVLEIKATERPHHYGQWYADIADTLTGYAYLVANSIWDMEEPKVQVALVDLYRDTGQVFLFKSARKLFHFHEFETKINRIASSMDPLNTADPWSISKRTGPPSVAPCRICSFIKECQEGPQ